MTKHSLIFIHGMGVGNPEESYDALWNSIESHYNQIHDLEHGEFSLQFDRVSVNYKDITFGAKKDIYQAAFPDLNPDEPTLWDVFHPVHALRYFMTFFLGDVTAYVSENDNNIRRRVWEQIKEQTSGGSYSILAHSLGSIIAFDFLYHLFERKEIFLPEEESNRSIISEFNHDRERVTQNFHNLFTFGSPIGLFMMRQDNMWKNRPTFLNIQNPIRRLTDDGVAHTWLNFHDREDIVAYPLENLFNRNPANQIDRTLTDIEVQTGNLVIDSHIKYWSNDKMASRIAQTLPFPAKRVSKKSDIG